MTRRIIHIAVCAVLSAALSLCASHTIDRNYHRKSVDNLHSQLRSDTLPEYWFIDTVNISLDNLDENTFHHMDIRSRLTDSSDIERWNLAYGNIEWIWPYEGTVESYHGIVLDPDEETIVELQQYPFKYGVPYKPVTEEDFSFLVEDGQNAMKYSIRYGKGDIRNNSSMTIASVLSAVDNRYYTLYRSDTTECRRNNVEMFRRYGFNAFGPAGNMMVYYKADYLGFYKIGRRERCIAPALDFAIVFIISFAVIFLLSCLIKRK